MIILGNILNTNVIRLNQLVSKDHRVIIIIIIILYYYIMRVN